MERHITFLSQLLHTDLFTTSDDENDTTDTPLYACTSFNAGTNTTARPELSKEWVTREGFTTPTADKTVTFKVCNSYTSSTGTANVAKVNYEVDDVIIYDMTNAKTITLPEGANVTSGNVLTVNGVNYAMAESKVSVTYAKDGCRLESSDAKITKNGDTYTFTVGDSNVSIKEVTGFENFVTNGDMQTDTETMKKSWTFSTNYVTGVDLSIVDDIEGNKVLKFNGSQIAAIEGKTANSTLQYTTEKLKKDTKYYYSYKIRLASDDENDTTTTPLYACTSFNAGLNTTAKPELSKEWATREGFTTPIEDKTVTFKVCNSYTSSIGTANVAKVNYEVDDVVIYDMTNAKTITLPEGASVTSGSVVTVDGVSYAMPESEISVAYADDDYKLVAEGAELTQNGNAYTFTIGDSDVTINAIRIIKPLANLIPQGDMEDENAVFSTVGEKSFITEQALTTKPDNKVLKIDGTTEPDAATKLTIKSLTQMTAGRTYYIDFDYKANYNHVRVRNADWKPEIIGVSGDANTWYRFSKMITDEDTNIITPAADTYYLDITVGNNEKGKELYIDNLVFYDITDAVEVATNTNDAASIECGDGLQTVNGELMANKGTVAKFKVEPNIGHSVLGVVVNGTTLTPDAEGVYSFTVADSNNAITVTTQRELVNLIPQGNMEDSTATFTVRGEASFETDQALTDNPDNHVLKIDGSSAEKATNLTLSSLTKMTAGNTYYIDFDYKIIENSHVRVRDAEHGNAITTNNGYADTWYRLSEMYKSGNNTLTPTEDTYYQDIIVGTGTVGTELYIDNLVFYDITDAYKIALPEGAEITDGGVSNGSVGFAFPGRTVSFTVAGTPDYVMVNGTVVTGINNTYSFTMPQSEVTVLAVNGQAGENIVKYAVANNKPYAIFDENATVTLIVAGYGENGQLTHVYTSEVTGTAGQQIDLTTVEDFANVSNWKAKTIFTWDNLTNLTPIRSACVLNDL